MRAGAAGGGNVTALRMGGEGRCASPGPAGVLQCESAGLGWPPNVWTSCARLPRRLRRGACAGARNVENQDSRHAHIGGPELWPGATVGDHVVCDGRHRCAAISSSGGALRHPAEYARFTNGFRAKRNAQLAPCSLFGIGGAVGAWRACCTCACGCGYCLQNDPGRLLAARDPGFGCKHRRGGRDSLACTGDLRGQSRRWLGSRNRHCPESCHRLDEEKRDLLCAKPARWESCSLPKGSRHQERCRITWMGLTRRSNQRCSAHSKEIESEDRIRDQRTPLVSSGFRESLAIIGKLRRTTWSAIKRSNRHAG